MRRKLFTILAAISLLLLIAVAGLGVRGYFRFDTFWYRHTTNFSGGGGHVDLLRLQSSQGRLWLGVYRWNMLTDSAGDGLHHDARKPEHLYFDDRQLGQSAGRLGFGLEADSWDPVAWVNRTAILLPAWFLALLFSLLPALRLSRWIIDRRLNRPGFCRQCGYDLRATPLRCPECGTVASPLSVVRSQ